MLLSDLTGINPSRRVYKPSSIFYDPAGLFGVEVEAEFASPQMYNANPDYWSQEQDGSLRGWNREYISSPPVFGEDAAIALHELEAGLSTYDVRDSWRCGLHVHLDVSGLSVKQLLSVVVGFALVEPALFRYVGVERKENIHCLPFADTGNVWPLLNNIKYGSQQQILHAINNLCKYSAINLRPISYQGSIEFRHHPGEYRANEIIKWVNMLMRIKVESMNQPPELLASMSRHDLSKLLLGDDIEYTQSDYLEGYYTAKDVLNFNKLEDTWNSVKSSYGDPAFLRR